MTCALRRIWRDQAEQFAWAVLNAGFAHRKQEGRLKTNDWATETGPSGRGGHRGEKLLLEESGSPYDVLITTTTIH